MRLGRQLPAYSPLSGAAVRRAALSGFAPGRDGQSALRAALQREYAADEVRLFGSGTQALQVALELAIRQSGDAQVALPAFTCFAVAAAAVGARARIHCYDLDPNTLGPDFASLRRVLDRGVRVAVFTPLYGYPIDWDGVTQLLAGYGAVAIEDAAQGDHAGWRGRPLGSLGPISVLSFGRGKGWTGGGGGALLV
ncbi:MAG: DegT/DnrJ/EryC1/StrS family aminotransferase, partial [Gemmatimonadales bacterium]